MSPIQLHVQQHYPSKHESSDITNVNCILRLGSGTCTIKRFLDMVPKVGFNRPKLVSIAPTRDILVTWSYNEACYFHPISTNASSEEDEDMKENIDYQTDVDVKENVGKHADERANNYENYNFESITEGRIKTDNSIIDKQKNIDAFLRGLEEINSFSPFLYEATFQNNRSKVRRAPLYLLWFKA
ncbi:hypothetical protein TNCT_371501 [Trichonephila clavata]|uniref:Uncharacterized protein n=1 Tax=Trichonephila clavata TaxID=2740835 RepID=A0A8X6FBE0_TRICU|nr:hypothetical protein TNCT_371501 [Trichonephila clavata]